MDWIPWGHVTQLALKGMDWILVSTCVPVVKWDLSISYVPEAHIHSPGALNLLSNGHITNQFHTRESGDTKERYLEEMFSRSGQRYYWLVVVAAAAASITIFSGTWFGGSYGVC